MIVRVSYAAIGIFHFASTTWAQPAPLPTQSNTTYCNPISLPNYPLGSPARKSVPGTVTKPEVSLWLLGHKEQFSELADVSVLWHDNKWIMYPSIDMAWVVTENLASGQFKLGEDFAFPFRFRHGSILPITADELKRVRASY